MSRDQASKSVGTHMGAAVDRGCRYSDSLEPVILHVDLGSLYRHILISSESVLAHVGQMEK